MAVLKPDEYATINFPTLGFLAADWVEAHCIVPSGFTQGAPFVHDGWQLLCTLHFYRVREDAKLGPNGESTAANFQYRRGLIVGPQKSGKSPYAASIIAYEAVGPCLFAGWAEEDEAYLCADYGCGCGFEYWYEPGEPKGKPYPGGKLIQMMATAEDQTDNVYQPLLTMSRRGPLSRIMKPREGFIRLPNDGRIDPVTAKATYKLGNPVSFAVGDESGLYTQGVRKAWGTIRRGVAGMGGRTLEITNPWDPMENSAAQGTYKYAAKADNIFVYYLPPPPELDFEDPADRALILKHVYQHSPWVDRQVVEAECAELMDTDPAEAMRFFGNKLVQGKGAYLQESTWDSATVAWPDALRRVYGDILGGGDEEE